MKKHYVLFLLITIPLYYMIAQDTLYLHPDAIEGKDAYLRNLSPNDNFGDHFDFSAH